MLNHLQHSGSAPIEIDNIGIRESIWKGNVARISRENGDKNKASQQADSKQEG